MQQWVFSSRVLVAQKPTTTLTLDQELTVATTDSNLVAQEPITASTPDQEPTNMLVPFRSS